MNFIDTADRRIAILPVNNVVYLTESMKDDSLLMTQSKIIESENFSVQGSLNLEDIKRIECIGINPKEQLKSLLTKEVDSIIEHALYKKYMQLGESNFSSNLTTRERFLVKIFPSLKFSYYAGSEGSLFTSDAINKIILNESHKLKQCSRTKFIVVSSKMFSYIAENAAFVCNTNTNRFGGESSFMGTLYNATVFVSYKIRHDDTHILLGTMTRDFSEGVVFLEGKKSIDECELVDHISYMPTVKIWVSQRAGISDVGNAKDYFNYFDIKFKRKPFWRKLLNIR